MNILHLITTLDIGGAEMHVLAQVRGQVERGHSPEAGNQAGGIWGPGSAWRSG